jgi:hypothetical protein
MPSVRSNAQNFFRFFMIPAVFAGFSVPGAASHAKAETVELPAIGEPARVESPACAGFDNPNTALNTVRDYFLQKALGAGITMAGGGPGMAVLVSSALINNPNTGNFLRGALGMNNGQSVCSVICTDTPVPPGADAWVTTSWKSNPAATAGLSLLNRSADPQYGGIHPCWGNGGIGWCGVGWNSTVEC